MPMMSRQEMERTIDAGGSVLMPDGSTLTRKDQIPLDEAEIKRRQAALDEQRRKLDADAKAGKMHPTTVPTPPAVAPTPAAAALAPAEESRPEGEARAGRK